MDTDDEVRRIFISYRVAEHRDLVPKVVERLRSEGFEIFVDVEFIPATNLDPLAASVAPKTTGVPTVATLGLLKCDSALVLLGPTVDDPAGDSFTRWQDWMDRLGEALTDLAARGGASLPIMVGVGDAVVLWYLAAYNFDVSKQDDETWQQWELRLSEFLGLAFVSIEVPPVGTCDHSIRAAWVDARVRELVPLLRAVPKGREKPVPRPAFQVKFAVGRRVDATVDACRSTADKTGKVVREIGRRSLVGIRSRLGYPTP
ncbi:hypothetical protein [Virgisporangium aurantiacum]|uniref:TIR domain-containing protein n=1 Tax=Virgisporangium aurantiacum TaxID=175570 RepID=A0A8J4E7B2_9ACTN|nr:hypothetical protein [Virgisporangium aurantiacum]GIJ64930.1 hypothetical protein Vau01_124460 [Virgisporangium aurantiacum]